MDDFLDIENIDPEVLAQLMEMGVLDDQKGILSEQIAQADALRGSPGPEGRDSGRIYTAANPLEFIGHGLQQYAANRDLKNLREQQQGILDKQTAGRQAFLDAMMKRKSGVQQAPFEGYGPQPQDPEGIY